MARPASHALARAQRGTTLLEVLLVTVVLGVTLAVAVPRAARAMEEARVDEAGAVLRSLWHAQRLFALEAGAYAVSVAQLVEARVLEAGLFGDHEPFTLRLAAADGAGFRFEAERAGSSVWSGVLAIDESGALTGSIGDGEGHVLTPGDL